MITSAKASNEGYILAGARARSTRVLNFKFNHLEGPQCKSMKKFFDWCKHFSYPYQMHEVQNIKL